jgi:hypothetical protein
MTGARALMVAIATSCVVLSATGAASASAPPRARVHVDGVIARVADPDCGGRPDARPYVDPGCRRAYVAYSGALVSTQPSWLSLQGTLDPDGRGATIEGDQGFTGCLGRRCGTLRLSIRGHVSYVSPSGGPIVDGVARIRRARGGLAGLEGALSFHIGRSGAYAGVLDAPGQSLWIPAYQAL